MTSGLPGVTSSRPGGVSTDGRTLVEPVATSHTLYVGPEAEWFRLDCGRRVELLRRGPMRRVLVRLLQEHAAGRGAVPVERLFEAGWPGTDVHPRSAAMRVYVTVRMLRDAGLRPVLQTVAGGYRLDPTLCVEHVPDGC